MANTHDQTRLATGVAGLDDILVGGLPKGQMYLLEGDPGTGKTTIAMQFVLEGIARGETALYVTLSEPRSELESSADSHGWETPLPIVEFVPDEASLSPQQQYTVFHPSEIELASTIERLIKEIELVRPDRLVIDSLSELRLLADDAMRYRRQLLALKQYFSGRRTTVLLLDDRTTDHTDLQLQSIAHGVLRLEKLARSYGVTRRRVEIIKMRGSSFREGFHDYTIERGGVRIYPRLVAAEHTVPFTRERISSGLPAIDALLAGGIDRGSSTLITGPTGVGKSSLTMLYAYHAALRGEVAKVFSFDESLHVIETRSEGMSMPLEPCRADGSLELIKVDPAELSPGEFSSKIQRAVEQEHARVIVIDGLNGLLNAMPGEMDLVLHLHELLSYLNHCGVVTLMTLTMQGLVGSMQTPLDVSYLADSVILLRYFEVRGEIRQALSVLKKRIGAHERTIRELRFSADGIYVGEPLTSFRGLLTGVPQYLDSDDSDSEHPDYSGE